MAELLFVAGAQDYAGDGGAAEEPVEGDLWNALAGFFGDGVESVDYSVEVIVGNLRAEVGGFVQAALFGKRMAATDFSGEAAPAERAPD